MPEYSNYQKKVISRYYENRDQIDRQRLEELVTNLYLASSAKQIAKHWETARGIMTRIGIPQQRIDHVIESQDATVLAAVVDELHRGVLKLEKRKPSSEPTS